MITISFTIILQLIICVKNIKMEGREGMVKSDFNLGWIFYKEGHERDKKEVALPHDAMIYEQRSREAVTAGACGYFPGGKYVYEKSFEAPVEWEGKKIILEFEGIYQQAQVYLNGQLTGTNIYGYSNFYVPLENGLVYGESNQLKVVADNSKCPNSRWYSGTGIYRPVWLYIFPTEHILRDEIRVKTLDYQKKKIAVDVKTTGVGMLCTEIFDGEKLIVSKTIQSEDTVENAICDVKEKTVEYHTEMVLEQTELWSPKYPKLYTCRVTFGEDIQEVRFGIRTVTCDAEHGFCINGKRVILRGACIHHDNGLLGACAYDFAERRKIRILQENGYNAIRSAHNPCSKAMLDACDEFGMLVMDEYIDGWYIHKTKYDYADIILDNYKTI